jgi:hypothetical protein
MEDGGVMEDAFLHRWEGVAAAPADSMLLVWASVTI